jgi:hypothetical protein
MQGQWIVKEHKPFGRDGELLHGCLGLQTATPTDRLKQGVQFVKHLDCWMLIKDLKELAGGAQGWIPILSWLIFCGGKH